MTQVAADPPAPEPSDPLTAMRDELDTLRAVVVAQQRSLDAHERELDRLRDRRAPTGSASHEPDHLEPTAPAGGQAVDGAAIDPGAQSIDGLGSTMPPPSVGELPPSSADPPHPAGAVDRRHLLAAATGAAAGVAAAAVVGASPAAANNGDPLAVGQTTTATATTTLKYETAGSDAILYVSDRATSQPQRNAAVEGNASNANRWGVSGYSDGTGGGGGNFVAVGATAYGLLAAAPRANAIFPAWTSSATAPPTRSDAHQRGELLTDGAGDIWMCVATGSPGQWRKIAGPATAGQLHVLNSTTRIYDSRAGQPPNGVTKGKITSGQTRDLSALVGGAVPNGAIAILANLTVVNTSAAGFLALFNGNVVWPGNSSVNWFMANSVVANLAVVSLSSLGTLRAFCSGNASTDFILDVVGYYR